MRFRVLEKKKVETLQPPPPISNRERAGAGETSRNFSLSKAPQVWRVAGNHCSSPVFSYLPPPSLYRERQTTQRKEVTSNLTKMHFLKAQKPPGSGQKDTEIPVSAKPAGISITTLPSISLRDTFLARLFLRLIINHKICNMCMHIFCFDQ